MAKIEASQNRAGTVERLPPALLRRDPLAWLAMFGPGAIIASLTIGTGELIFSTRGGCLFGYRILFFFVMVSVLKWGLVLATSRHIVLSGVHPYRRTVALPGPKGWFPMMLFLVAVVALPIWTSFHSSATGNFISWVTGTQKHLNGAIDYLWGGAILAGVLVLSATGGYTALERVQLAIVTVLILCSIVTLVIYNPDWLEMLRGVLIPHTLKYPDWLPERYPTIASQPVWVETTRYAGVIGGGGLDYMAYATWVRQKRWGYAGVREASRSELTNISRDRSHPARRWTRAPLIDCTLSFAVVIAFSAVFVASGVVVLGPNREIPTEANLLSLQSQFVTSLHSWLLPIYVSGAILTMLGTLYGTIEVAKALLVELTRSLSCEFERSHRRRLEQSAVLWCALGAYAVLVWSFCHTWLGGAEKPRIVLAFLTPANLFTGVLACGLFSAVAVWSDWRFLPKGLRMPLWLALLNVLSAVVFVALGVKGYWDNHQPDDHWTKDRWFAILAISAVLVISVLVARLMEKKRDGNA